MAGLKLEVFETGAPAPDVVVTDQAALEEARLTAYEGETKIFERSFDDEVPRVFV